MDVEWKLLGLALGVGVVLEAVTDQIDNLVVPLAVFAAMHTHAVCVPTNFHILLAGCEFQGCYAMLSSYLANQHSEPSLFECFC